MSDKLEEAFHSALTEDDSLPIAQVLRNALEEPHPYAKSTAMLMDRAIFEIEQLQAMLRKCRDAMDMAEEDIFGKVLDTRDRQGWYIRDEMVAEITKVLG